VRILYDADCGFCRWALGWVLRWDRARRLEPVALQDPRAAELLSEVEVERRMKSWHLVGPDGSLASAGAAAAPLLRLLPAGAPLARVAERAPAATERAYALVAGSRSTLGRFVSEGAKARADRLIAERRAPASGASDAFARVT
jgi:predicted DCC family thiol-disulfide oxidoreductase YuxK